MKDLVMGATSDDFTDEQLERIDEVENAAYEFLKVLAETDDIPRDPGTIWDLIYEGCNQLTLRYERRVHLPTHVTDEHGIEYITDWYEE